MNKAADINKIIEDAIALLNDDTWCKGEERSPSWRSPDEYRYCAIGAMKEAAGFNWANHTWPSEEAKQAWWDAQKRCDEVVRAEGIMCDCGCGHLGNSGIVSYNDTPTTTAEDVKLMMKRAIET